MLQLLNFSGLTAVIRQQNEGGLIMTHKFKFYCVKSWSTCKKAKAWLSQNNIEYQEVDLLKETPSYEELQNLAKLAQKEIKELVNRRSQAFKKMPADIDKMNNEEVAKIINENPRILLRPILTDGVSLVSGFKEENYQQFVGLS